MSVNSDTFDLNPIITDDWGGAHRVHLEIEARSDIQNWSLELKTPYNLEEIYGAVLTKENGKTFISGVDWNQNLRQGDQTDVIFIIYEDENSNLDPIPLQFNFADSVNNSELSELDNSDPTPTPQQSESNSETLSLTSTITDDWGGSHRVALNVEALSDISNWSLEVSVPNNYVLDQIYGAESFQENDKTFISGVEWN